MSVCDARRRQCTVNCPFQTWVAVMPTTVTDLGALETITLAGLLTLDSQRTLVITVNNRHARRLLSQLSASLRADRRVMPLPSIVPLSAWYRQAADELSFLPEANTPSHYLDAFAARGLWRQIIDAFEGDAESALLDKSAAARLAFDADLLADEWQLNIDPALETPDYQRFSVWRTRYRERLFELDAEDGNISIARVCAAARSGLLPLGFDTLVLVGFNELSPRLGVLLSSFRHQGASVKVLAGQRPAAGKLQRVVVPDTDPEWWAAAQWARDCLADNPQGRYAIVASRLEDDVALAYRVLRQTLPESEGVNIAVARPLAQWPLVRAALAWLSVLADFRAGGRCTPGVLGAALLAGACSASVSEFAARARLDAFWRKKAVVQLSLPEFTQALADFSPRLHQAWVLCADRFMGGATRAGLHEWSVTFRDYLQCIGFPGEELPGSTAFQTLEAFDRTLGQLGQYGVVWGSLSFAEAVGVLNRLVNETPFQPQRNPFARLDVLGLLEAEGGRWDGVWVLGLTDEVLPAPTRPNPLIPAAVLRHAGAPRATPERELQWASVLFDDLVRLAPQVVFSHARHAGESELRASPFIAALAGEAKAPSAMVFSAPVSLESMSDACGPALGADETVSGGIALLDAQARNPLWAFVKYRLGASQLPDYAPPGSPNARGLFMHRVMELVWDSLKSSGALTQAMSDGTLASLLDRALHDAAREYLSDYSDTLRELEMQRARGVVLDWLALEQTRAPFDIAGLEKTIEWSQGVLKLTLRIDRLDRLEDGQIAIIDYKTGAGKPQPRADWLRNPPIDLQLPFYASVVGSIHEAEQRTGALVLARLHSRECLVKGFAETDLYGFKGLDVLPDWSAVLMQWRDAIRQLANAFIAGNASNTFVQAKDLMYCDVLPFLRLNESVNEALNESEGHDG